MLIGGIAIHSADHPGTSRSRPCWPCRHATVDDHGLASHESAGIGRQEHGRASHISLRSPMWHIGCKLRYDVNAIGVFPKPACEICRGEVAGADHPDAEIRAERSDDYDRSRLSFDHSGHDKLDGSELSVVTQCMATVKLSISSERAIRPDLCCFTNRACATLGCSVGINILSFLSRSGSPARCLAALRADIV